MELDIRKQKILKAIIEEYNATGEPVGSKRICSLLDVAVSPATVRNDMATLFERGLLEQPYTSAGRVPSHLGYRYYLNNLLAEGFVASREQADIEAMFNGVNPDPDRLLADAALVLANFTRCVTIFSTNTPKSVCVKRVELIPATETTVVIMVIASNGVIKNKVCRVRFQVSPRICEFFTSYANSRLSGKSLNEITSSYIHSVANGMEEYAKMFDSLLIAIYELCKEINDGQFYIRGETNLLSYKELKEDAGDLLILLDKKQQVLDLIPKEPFEIKVTVGKENNRMELSNSSVLFVKYKIGEEQCGTIGVIGPVRLNYAKLIAHTRYFAHTLGELLTDTLNH